jgi:hypothetical protein
MAAGEDQGCESELLKIQDTRYKMQDTRCKIENKE